MGRHPAARGGTGLDHAHLPPGPRLPRLVQSAALLRFRHRFVPWLHRRYGDVFTVRLVPAPRATVFFTRPDAIRDVFAGDPDVFHAGEANSILGPVMGEHSLLLVDGAQHRRARRLLMPAFSGRAMRGYEDLVTDVARAEVASWRPGVELRALDRMNALTLEVILRVVFGVTDDARLDRLRPSSPRRSTSTRPSSSAAPFRPCAGSGCGAGPPRRSTSSTPSSTPRSASAAPVPTSPGVATCSRG
ncbi:cytochrome P450 [Oryzobacter terrae]|uniref:cytochrome P450 n=1 Tax=Oryzobacter terrae TaxID=1620385 RepID=UPI00366BE44E